jgi:acyl carrier protein
MPPTSGSCPLAANQLARLTDVFQTVFNMPDLQLRDSLTAAGVPGWDSFNHITLMITIEQEFGVHFTSDEVSALNNVGELMQLLAAKLACG